MSRSALLAAALLTAALAGPADAAPTDEATAFLRGIMDKFNAGDVDAFLAVHADDAIIVDEFAPYAWTGVGSARRWVESYGADSKARGISGGRVDYGKPLQATGDASAAYIVLPTTYRFTQNGKKMAAPGSMTFIVRKGGKDWRIASWTYSGATPAPEK